jgi:catechol 2,3-dioxygenase-like lactoylglutathione lyase family enzyme
VVTARLLPQATSETATGAIDHVTLVVRDFAAARRFYAHALRPFGLRSALDWADGRRAHFGLPGEPSLLWVAGGAEERLSAPRLGLAAADREAVQAFHASALAAGGQSLDPPRIREEHTAWTYAASVSDPDGNVVEAFCWDVR